MSYRLAQLGTIVSELTFGTSLSPDFPPVGSFLGPSLGPFPLSTSKCYSSLCSEADQNTLDNIFFKLVKKKNRVNIVPRRGEKG